MTKSTSRSSRTKPSASRASRRSAQCAPGPAKRDPTKLAILKEHLSRARGASIAELTEATGWQPHSVRGAMSGALKAKGLVIVSDVNDGVRRYRIEASQ